MADCINYVDYVASVFSRNQNLLYGPIAQNLKLNSPYINVLKSGTFPAQVASTLLAVAQGRTLMGSSLANPSFTSMLNLCGSAGLTVDKNGTNQWSYEIEIGSGRSDKICLSSAFSAFKESLLSMVNAYQDGVTQLINADLRWQLFLRSGVKAVVQTGTPTASMIAGGENQIDVAVPAIQSDAELDMTTLLAFNRYMRSVLMAKPFGGTGGGAHARLIAGTDLIDDLRNDMGGSIQGNALIMPLGGLAAGGDSMAITGLKSYLFEGLIRGVMFGEDQRELRLNWNGAGYDPVTPDIADAASAGTVAVTNPAWLEASHHVSFLFYDSSFQRLTPENWFGEGKVRFDQQMYGGQIKFMNHPDMDCNLFGDWGVLAHRIGRGLKPLYPWFVLPIISKRCIEPTTLDPCTGVSG
jgi:hypothetical protein